LKSPGGCSQKLANKQEELIERIRMKPPSQGIFLRCAIDFLFAMKELGSLANVVPSFLNCIEAIRNGNLDGFKEYFCRGPIQQNKKLIGILLRYILYHGRREIYSFLNGNQLLKDICITEDYVAKIFEGYKKFGFSTSGFINKDFGFSLENIQEFARTLCCDCEKKEINFLKFFVAAASVKDERLKDLVKWLWEQHWEKQNCDPKWEDNAFNQILRKDETMVKFFINTDGNDDFFVPARKGGAGISTSDEEFFTDDKYQFLVKSILEAYIDKAKEGSKFEIDVPKFIIGLSNAFLQRKVSLHVYYLIGLVNSIDATGIPEEFLDSLTGYFFQIRTPTDNDDLIKGICICKKAEVKRKLIGVLSKSSLEEKKDMLKKAIDGGEKDVAEFLLGDQVLVQQEDFEHAILKACDDNRLNRGIVECFFEKGAKLKQEDMPFIPAILTYLKNRRENPEEKGKVELEQEEFREKKRLNPRRRIERLDGKRERPTVLSFLFYEYLEEDQRHIEKIVDLHGLPQVIGLAAQAPAPVQVSQAPAPRQQLSLASHQLAAQAPAPVVAQALAPVVAQAPAPRQQLSLASHQLAAQAPARTLVSKILYVCVPVCFLATIAIIYYNFFSCNNANYGLEKDFQTPQNRLDS
jgi:hypothetical protein